MMNLFLDKKIIYDDSADQLKTGSALADISCIFRRLNCETSACNCGGKPLLIGGEYMQQKITIRQGFSGND